MTADTYIKSVVTGILACLVCLCLVLTPIGTSVEAQLGPTPVVLSGYVVGGTTRPLDQGLPVDVVSGSRASTAATPDAAPASPSPVNTVTAPSPRSSTPAATSQRCQAITQKGTLCSRNAKAGSKYCWQHGG